MADEPAAGGEAGEGADSGEVIKVRLHTYPLVRHTDMVDEMRNETVDISIGAVEKYAENYELAAKTIKESMDKKFGIYWHVIVGENYGFEFNYETKHLMYMYLEGNIAVVIWKCA